MSGSVACIDGCVGTGVCWLFTFFPTREAREATAATITTRKAGEVDAAITGAFASCTGEVRPAWEAGALTTCTGEVRESAVAQIGETAIGEAWTTWTARSTSTTIITRLGEARATTTAFTTLRKAWLTTTATAFTTSAC